MTASRHLPHVVAVAVAAWAWGCASVTLPPSVPVTTLAAIEGQWTTCSDPNWTTDVPIMGVVITPLSAERGELKVIWRANPSMAVPVAIHNGAVVVADYRTLKPLTSPLLLTSGGGRDYLTVPSVSRPRPWLECQRPSASRP